MLFQNNEGLQMVLLISKMLFNKYKCTTNKLNCKCLCHKLFGLFDETIVAPSSIGESFWQHKK